MTSNVNTPTKLTRNLTPEQAMKRKKNRRRIDMWRRFKKNKAAVVGLIIIAIFAIAAIFADNLAPYPYDMQNLPQALQTPSMQHLLGTDQFGRDLLSRIMYGARISLLVGFISVGLGCLAGGILGAIAAFYGGKADMYIMRVLDILQCMPSLLFAISVAAALGPGLFNAMVAIGITSVPKYGRVTRAAVMVVRDEEYVKAAHALGARDGRTIIRHIVPNSLAPIIVQASLGVAGAILDAAALSFLGLGVQPPTPEWGSMLNIARSYIRDCWSFVTFPGLAIMIIVICVNLAGDGLRDALDPRLKQ